MAQETALPPIVAERASIAESKSRLGRFATFHSLRYRDFNLLFQGQVGAAASNWMEQIARPLLILQLTDSALMVGLGQAMRLIPQLILGIWAGVLADRVDRRHILIVSNTLVLAMHLTVAILIFSGVVQAWMLLITTLITGCGLTIDQPARQSLIPKIVPREALANAVALNSMAGNVMRIFGGAIAGLMLVFLDFGEVYIAMVAIYAWVIFTRTQMHTDMKPEKIEQTSMMTSLLEGFDAVKKDKAILYLIILSLVLFIWAFPYQSVFIPLLAVQVLDIGKSGAGLLISLTGIGALVGSLMVATAGDSVRHRGPIMISLIFTYIIGLFILARAESIVLAVPALLITGGSQVSFMSMLQAYMFGRTAPELHGRMISLLSLDRGLIPLGATIGGALAAWLGPQDALTIMAGICLLSAITMVVFVPSLRKIS